MTKIYVLFLLLLFSRSFSQTYEFDFLTKYSMENFENKSTYDLVSYHNSDDFSYVLSLNKRDSDFTASIYDSQRNLAHAFDVIESKVSGEIQFQFNYITSSKMGKIEAPKNYRYEFSEISPNKPKIIALKVYPSKRSNNPIAECTLTLTNANKNFMPLFGSEVCHISRNDNNPILNAGNYIVSKTVAKNKNYHYETKLTEYKNVSFKIVVGEKTEL